VCRPYIDLGESCVAYKIKIREPRTDPRVTPWLELIGWNTDDLEFSILTYKERFSKYDLIQERTVKQMPIKKNRMFYSRPIRSSR